MEELKKIIDDQKKPSPQKAQQNKNAEKAGKETIHGSRQLESSNSTGANTQQPGNRTHQVNNQNQEHEANVFETVF